MRELLAVYFCTQLFVVVVVGGIGVQHLTSFVGITFKECFEQCQNRVSCQSILYRHRLTYCRVYGQYISNYIRGKGTPGLYYREKESGNTNICIDRECIPGETCDGMCTMTECPIPTANDDIQIAGNLRTLGSKIRYTCRNFFTQPVHSTCKANDSWYSAMMSCDTYAYAFSGTDTYEGRRYAISTGSNRFFLRSKYLDTCLSRCNETDKCFGVNFSPETKTCELTNVLTAQTDDDRQLVEIPGWNHYYRILPVAWYAKGGKRYEFLFNEAVDYCKNIGTSIASIVDLKRANKMGFGLCRCGWLEDGKSYLPLIRTCGRRTPGVSKCRSRPRVDVYCKDKRFI